MTTSQVVPTDVADSRGLQLAIAGYLSRFKALSRTHAQSHLRAYLTWCAARRLHPLTATQPQVDSTCDG
jgi:hypothetical protein